MESLKDLITTIEDAIQKNRNRNKSVMAYNKLNKPGTASKRKASIPFTRKKIEQDLQIGESGRPE